MHLFTILAFAILFWRADSPGACRLLPADDVFGTLLIVAGQPLLLFIAAGSAAKRSRRLHDRHLEAPQISQRFHHRSVFLLRLGLFLGFAAALLLTPWPDWFNFGRITPALQIVGDLIVLSPYFVGALVLWIAAYPAERALRLFGDPQSNDQSTTDGSGWRIGPYLDFNIRHHLLVVAIPMTLILFASNMTRGYGTPLRRWTGWVWTPDVLLGMVAGGVFVVAPLLLCRIWRTAPLESGPLRERLETICRRIGLRCRDILIWKSDGMMINAAVMGVFAPVRYVLLSDALLATMSLRQIEAVFGHEAGHVRHRHIQHFLVFALVGWLAVAGLMEGLARTSSGTGAWWGLSSNEVKELSSITIQGLGLAATVLFWGLGFGWVSRRFERQADLFGARCVTPSDSECDRPCSVHLAQASLLSGDPMCLPPYQGGTKGGGFPPYQGGTKGEGFPPYQGGTKGGSGGATLAGNALVKPLSPTGGSIEPTESQTSRPGVRRADRGERVREGPGGSERGVRAFPLSLRERAGVRGVSDALLDAQTPCTENGRVCATAAAIFASALQRVALLNGIPPEERSWRHSSIGSRIRFLVSLAGDPSRATRFERLIRRIKTTFLALAVLGGAFFLYYWAVVPQPALMQLQADVS